jgi:NADH:ubiquinone oxidoreductase subunit 5 (subunit L)/multisubunit Na+/H+ antiporter MnhA subunit
MLLTTIWLPVVTGVTLATWRGASRRALGIVATASLMVTLAVATWTAVWQPSATLPWGVGLQLQLDVAGISRLPVVLVPLVALAVTAYAAAHEERTGLSRLLGLLVVFVGAMELVLLAGDLLSLLIGWELVGAVSWALIAHDWRSDAPAQAAHAFNVTRAGDLGLFVAAGVTFATTGGLGFSDVAVVGGGAAHALAAGVLLAAVAKSAQVPFAPWLFSAMAGPTSASALLHSATMVAAGAYLLARLQPILDAVSWFGPTTITIGMVTALAGGVVAAVQDDAKKLLAASTSAQYGFMLVAVGTGYPAIAIAHLVAHGLAKALLFLSAGVAISAAGTRRLARMGLGRRLPAMAWLTASGVLALAAVPPLGMAWTKDGVVAAAAHDGAWLAVPVLAAGGFSAYYAARFQLLAFGRQRDRHAGVLTHRPGMTEHAAIGALGMLGILLGVLWLPAGQEALAVLTGGTLPPREPWELAASLATIAMAGYAAGVQRRRGRLGHAARTPRRRAVGDWFGLPGATRLGVVTPALATARAAARFDDVVLDGPVRRVAAAGGALGRALRRGDDRVVDAGVRGVAALAVRTAAMLDRVAELGVDGAVASLARLVGTAGHDSRRVQTGQAHTYYALIAVGTVVLIALTAVWSA